MDIGFGDARALVVAILTKYRVSEAHAGIVAEHLIDAAAAGHPFAGLPRVLALVEQLKQRPQAGEISFKQTSPNSVLIDGAGHNGYVTSLLGVDRAIELARTTGVGFVGIKDTWFSGRLAYYVERAARAGFVAVHSANTLARVAPAGGIDRIFGTNPIAFAFPGEPDPLVIDFGTGMTTWGDVLLREKLGRPLDPGVAVDREGQPTLDPRSALDGAFLPWGGHRGYGISLVVQLLAILCGSRVVVDEVSACGFFFLVFDPSMFMPVSQFRTEVAELVSRIETSRPAPGVPRVRVPGRSSTAARKAAQEKGVIPVDDAIIDALEALRVAPAPVG
uniref:Ldh family oxidoreductase n=1 Tax=Bosea sp. NBC_00436 TaxID=2969620 RepID=A0A9E7ZTJ5_9HYPH